MTKFLLLLSLLSAAFVRADEITPEFLLKQNQAAVDKISPVSADVVHYSLEGSGKKIYFHAKIDMDGKNYRTLMEEVRDSNNSPNRILTVSNSTYAAAQVENHGVDVLERDASDNLPASYKPIIVGGHIKTPLDWAGGRAQEIIGSKLNDPRIRPGIKITVNGSIYQMQTLVGTYSFDADKDFILVGMQMGPSESYLIENTKVGDVWVPQKVTVTRKKSANQIVDVRVTEYSNIRRDPLPPSTFTVMGMGLDDGTKIRWIKSGTDVQEFVLAQGELIPAMEWVRLRALKKEGMQPTTRPVTDPYLAKTSERHGVPRTAIGWIAGLVLAGTVVAFVVFRKASGRKRVV